MRALAILPVWFLFLAQGVASAQAGWPGATGKSGANGDPLIDRASVEAFGTWRGRPASVAVVYTDRTSWAAMTTNSSWVFNNFKGFPGLLVISQGLVPNGRAQDIAACASGWFDQQFRDFGSLMVSEKRADAVVRLGWEFNGDWFPWAATNTQQWIDCYRHAALAIRSTNSQARFDWTINSKGTPASLCGGRATNCYPGDDVVDIIGIDNYDLAPSSPTAAEFERIANAPEGLNWLLAFAKSHNKLFSVGEWGVAPSSSYNTTGDNPTFVYCMHNWFRNNAPWIAYEAYFNHCSAGVGSNIFRPAQGDCARNIQSGGLYQLLFRDPAILEWPDPR